MCGVFWGRGGPFGLIRLQLSCCKHSMLKMDIHDVTDMAQALMKDHGLFEKGWTFKIDRAKARCGCCMFGPNVISISKFYIQGRRVTSRDVRNTVLHEIAHALAGPDAGHGPEWKAIAQEIGCDGTRLNMKWTGEPRRYVISCACGRIYRTRHRLHGYYKNHTCKKCDSIRITDMKDLE